MTNFDQAKYVNRWRCSRCDFDLCINCALKFGEVVVDNLTDEEHCHAYFVVCSTKLSHIGSTNTADVASDPVILKFFDESEAFDVFDKI